MNPIRVSDILELPVHERLQLVEAIWESIAEVPEAIELSENERSELDTRLSAYLQDPSVGAPWAEVRSRIMKA